MSIFSENLKFLRASQDVSQQALAKNLNLSRSNIAKYEAGVHEPSLEVILRISRYFKITVDTLLTVDMHKHGMGELREDLIMPVQVDRNGDDIIEIIPHDASAGYLGSYSDPEYIESLEHLYLPFLTSRSKSRAFPVRGDSMPPIIDGSYIIGNYITSIQDIRIGLRYILVSRDEGIVFKRISKIKDGYFYCQSDNPIYETFTMHGRDIIEVWEFAAAIMIQDAGERHLENVLVEKINSLQTELQALNEKIKVR
jgi:transcriptional regulator with XRE-family HTH domain